MSATETTTLLPVKNGDPSPSLPSATSTVSTIFITLQVLLLLFFGFGTSYSSKDYEVKEYVPTANHQETPCVATLELMHRPFVHVFHVVQFLF